MELSQKLQELRKQKSITQEELARELYVSRTAISKWESGRGVPSIDSLKAIAKFFSVTLDELLSSDELVNIVEKDSEDKKNHFRDLVFGFLDVFVVMLLFLPFFAVRQSGAIATSLLFSEGVKIYLKLSYFVLVICTAVFGILTLALQNFEAELWQKSKALISLVLSGALLILFTVSLQPYAAVFVFVLLAIKVIMLIKWL